MSKYNTMVADYAPGIDGGGAQQKTCCGTYSGDGGDVILQGRTIVIAEGVGAGQYTGGKNHPGNAFNIQKKDLAILINFN